MRIVQHEWNGSSGERTDPVTGTGASASGARYEQIAEQIRETIRTGRRQLGELLESAAALAAAYPGAPGPVGEALRLLVSEGTAPRAARREGNGGGPPGGRQVLARQPRTAGGAEEVRSVAQWASAHGRTPGGQVIEQTWRIAGAENAAALRVDHRDRVLQVLRVRLLDGEKVMVERTSYPESLGEIVERIPADTASVSRHLADEHGIVFAGADHVFSATVCNQQDASLLGVSRGRPLLRHLRRSRDRGGRPLEFSE